MSYHSIYMKTYAVYMNGAPSINCCDNFPFLFRSFTFQSIYI